ncbi:dTDP-glucose 4,6-dehydratase [Candidatus Omnitrophota bacterium]
MKNKKILVSGAAGFIGSEFIRQIVKLGYRIVVVDSLTYAGDLARLRQVKRKIKFYNLDICNKSKINKVFKDNKPAAVVHFAAETHVDRSILGSDSFVKTNIEGTQNLLDASRLYNVKRFIHISTDEVYGDIKKGKFIESSVLNPSSPYSASKAASDLLLKSYVRTFDFPGIIVRPSNNYGPWQYPEKFVPVIMYKALSNQKIPVYAKGLNVREWLYVSDCAAAIIKILNKGRIGEIYNLGSGFEKRNIEVAKAILDILDKPHSLIEFVKDRPGHDYRYSLNFSKAKRELGYLPRVNFETGIKKTVMWYKENFDWLKSKSTYLRKYWKEVYKKKSQ